MRVLVACEWSNTVRDAFLARGHDAYSCSLERAEHPNPNWKRHIRGDVRPLLKKRWDLIIAHPPCTYLCNSGVWLIDRDKHRIDLVTDAAIFFLECFAANAQMVCVENPTMHKYAKEYIPWQPTQVIQPWMFGESYTKRTCLWLIGLPPLKPTNVVDKGVDRTCGELGSADSKERGRTFSGIASAMADQWGML